LFELFANGAFFDEGQHASDLFSYLQAVADEKQTPHDGKRLLIFSFLKL
jgi:hypothetical protein